MNRGSRSSVLSQQLFHGSSAELSPGDVIEPREHDHAYAFGKAIHAKDFGMVYQVRPIDPVEKRQETVQWRKSNRLHMSGQDVHVSKKGFRVVGPRQ